ncbi:MAG: ISAs1 family transposase [Chitinophagaceae bacterium]|nr:ISAs1 family transposase [Chitinophagaceae bacterium]
MEIKLLVNQIEYPDLQFQKAMTAILEHFGQLPDPRTKEHKIIHKLYDIVFITIAAVICGAEDWYDIEDYGEANQQWLSRFLELPGGLPSHDTYNRVFSLFDPQALQQCFVGWVQSIAHISEGQVVSIDGKQLRHSGEQGGKSIIHMVSAWSNANNMVLGRLKVNDKSNEITAIPALLEVLMLKGCWITIDAMGCQIEIAKKIREVGAEYILAVKDNQKHLNDDIKEAFAQTPQTASHTQLNVDHGRIEKRICRIITDMDWICSKDQWEGLQTIIEIISERTHKATGEKEKQVRHYISSIKAPAEAFNTAIREHWGIENKLHWVLDVCFGEDMSTKRAGTAAENFSFVSKVALNLLNQSEERKGGKKLSIKRKRKKADRDKDYLLSLLAKAG